MLFQIDIKRRYLKGLSKPRLRVMLFQIDIKHEEGYITYPRSLRVMLFQIDIKHNREKRRKKHQFESNVILDRYKTANNLDFICIFV